MKDSPREREAGSLILYLFRSLMLLPCSENAGSIPAVKFRRSRTRISDFLGSDLHSVIVSQTGSSKSRIPSWTAAAAATHQKPLVPLKIETVRSAASPCA